MHTDLMTFSEQLAHLPSLDACLAHVQQATNGLGFKTLIYDYAPVPVSHEGALITPSVFKALNAPGDMHTLWCEHGYYQIDPVQQCAARRTTPFVWSFGTGTHWNGALTDAHRPVAHYIRDYGLSTGLTVPLHLPDGGFATLTAIVDGTPADAEQQARRNLGELLVLAHTFQAQASELLAPAERCCAHIHLTRRERECLQHSAKGLSAKGIAAALNRSEATVNLHLIAAARKLGARNRVEAVARGLHYRLVNV
ncbi:helix-turn-helix transcriptional regulator [Pseudomonas sp. S1_E04]